jgi:hypothetical protein
MHAFELSLQRALTKSFIDADPVEIQLMPKTARVSDGAGGFVRGTDEPRDPQTFRLIPQNDRVPEEMSQESRVALRV